MNPFYIGLPGWVICTFVAYAIQERVIGQLCAQQIGAITLAQRTDRIRLLACLAGIVILFLALRFGLPRQQNLWFLLLLGATAIATVYFETRGYNSVLKLLPPASARTLIAARIIGLLGMVCIVGAMAATVL
jgi:hypothetical protein